MYRLSPASFDNVLALIEPKLLPQWKTAKYFVPPIIELCLGLHVLAGGSYLDLSFGYDVPHSTVHFYAWQALHAIDQSTDPYLDNIMSPTMQTGEELVKLEHGFAELCNFKLHGTVAAGDGVVFWMQMPTAEEVEGDVILYFTCKGYYAFGLQAFCDSKCRFVMILSKLSLSTNDNTTYIVTQLSKDIKGGKLPRPYHVVLDEAYPCTEQETSPWKGWNLPVERDAFNYYLSLHRQVIERAFGLLVQRWGIFWHPLYLSMLHQGLLSMLRVDCIIFVLMTLVLKELNQLVVDVSQDLNMRLTINVVTIFLEFWPGQMEHRFVQGIGLIWNGSAIEICGLVQLKK